MKPNGQIVIMMKEAFKIMDKDLILEQGTEKLFSCYCSACAQNKKRRVYARIPFGR